VLASIQFDDRLLFEANEIDNEFTYRLLPPKFNPFYLSSPKLIP